MFLPDASMLTVTKATLNVLPYPPGILARGPWPPARVSARWSERGYEPPAEKSAQADRAIGELIARGSPSHDGVTARLQRYEAADGELRLELQPMRWALRLLDNASGALSVLCVVRDHDGRWLAGRRAAWVATWAGMWALGAGGAVDAGEDPAGALGPGLAGGGGGGAQRPGVRGPGLTPPGT